MPLDAGHELAHFEILEPIGKGGMGEVYRARDGKLDRDVAIKVLPQELAAHAERLVRFEREAKLLASLNHPNIASIYGFESGALVLELVEGRTLAERIELGPVPVDEALAIARQMARALEAGHEAGIIHRDLKPGNVKVKDDGTVKVLDYGLAKALEAETPESSETELSHSPTLTRQGTQIGVILGTAAYMSPEQVKGKPVDRRADVWAFGVVLYEILTGQRAFAGADISETLASVLKTDVDLDALPAGTPPAIRTLLRRCLERDPLKRLPHIGAARLELEEAERAPSATDDAPHRTRIGRRRSSLLVAAGVLAGVALAAAAYAIWKNGGAAVSAEPVRFALLAPEGAPLFDGESGRNALAVSPDGRYVAFVFESPNVARTRSIWLRPLDAFSGREIPDTGGAGSLIWAPDGQSLVFERGLTDELLRVDLAGGAPRLLAARANEPGAWSDDGVILFRGLDGRIYRVDDIGGESEAVTELDFEHGEVAHYPEFFLPDGRRFAFRARSTDPAQTRLYLTSLDSKSRTPLIDTASNVALTHGHLVYQEAATLMVQPFDGNEGRVTGQAVPFVKGVAHGVGTGEGAFAVSSETVLAYRTGGASPSVLTWFDRTGKPVDTIPDFVGGFVERGTLSADGRSLAISRRAEGELADVWLVDLVRGVPTRFTFDVGEDRSPVFSPDGTRVVFASDRSGVRDLYARASGGAREASLLYQSPNRDTPMAFSPDGKALLFGAPTRSVSDIWVLPLEGGGDPSPIVSTGFPAGYAAFSPDGRWFAYCEGDSGADQVYVQPFPPDGSRTRLSTTNGSSPQWIGTEVFYATLDNRVMAVDVTNPREPARPRELFEAPATFEHSAFLTDATGERFLVPVPIDVGQPAEIHVVVNWLGALTRVASKKD